MSGVYIIHLWQMSMYSPDETIASDDAIDKSGGYDYFNKNDVDNFCPNVCIWQASVNDFINIRIEVLSDRGTYI